MKDIIIIQKINKDTKRVTNAYEDTKIGVNADDNTGEDTNTDVDADDNSDEDARKRDVDNTYR